MMEFNTEDLNGNGHESGGFSGKSVGAVSEFKRLERYFSKYGNVFEFDIYGKPIKWISEEVKITDDMGKVIFVQPDVKRPDFWSPLAIKVVAGKYFWGDQKKNERENSAEQLIGRVTRWIARQAVEQNGHNM